jgi:hypothetical protein
MTEIIEQGLMPKLGLAFSFGSENPEEPQGAETAQGN